MALTIKHNFQTALADDPAKDVSASEWNDAHGVTGVLDVANGGTGVTTGAVLRTGDTMSGNLTVNGVPIGNGVATGYYGDSSNLAIRTPGSGTIYFQSQSGAATYAQVNNTGLNVTSSLTIGGTASFNGQVTNNAATTIHSDQYFGAAGVSKFQIYGEPYPTIAFHCVGYFGANFGMNTDGNFYMGGWSHGGGVAYKFWTTRDFSLNPGNPLIATRLAYYGDLGVANNTGMQEPWPGVVSTGFTNDVFQSGQIIFRMRQLQNMLADGNWYASYYV